MFFFVRNVGQKSGRCQFALPSEWSAVQAPFLQDVGVNGNGQRQTSRKCVPSFIADFIPPISSPWLSAFDSRGVTMVTYLAFFWDASRPRLKLSALRPSVSRMKSNLKITVILEPFLSSTFFQSHCIFFFWWTHVVVLDCNSFCKLILILDPYPLTLKSSCLTSVVL